MVFKPDPGVLAINPTIAGAMAKNFYNDYNCYSCCFLIVPNS